MEKLRGMDTILKLKEAPRLPDTVIKTQ